MASSLLLRYLASLWPLPVTLAETQGPERDVTPLAQGGVMGNV